MKSIAILAAALCCAAQAAAPLSFQQALDLAEREAPTLALTTARIEASRQAARSAGELPDPKLSLGIENLPIAGPERYSLRREGMTMQRLAWMQELPSGAKRAARVAVAEARIERAEAEQALARVLARREAGLAWIQRRTLENQLAQLQALEQENQLFQSAVQAQLQGGKGMAADALMPRQEAAMLAERRDELEARRAQAVAQLRRWVGPAAAEALAGDLPAWQPQPEALHQRLHQHPEFRTVDAMAKTLDAEVREASAMKQPDWGVELAYQRRGPGFGDMVSVMFSVDLPLFPKSRQEPQIAAKLAERRAVDAEREAMRREHEQMLAADLAEWQRLQRAVARARGELLSLAEQRIALTLAAYRSGRASLTEVVAARRERAELLLKAIAMEGERDAMAARLQLTTAPEPTDVQPGAQP
ncbi:TolC family protein [Inhella proteolytica]|uniref:TolC family protein n=1 Tax=Inhella proteolytica TaxID=2795029 RepID=A0A931J6J9_9BURK|nr:TolC family protein [Inhella proteolytica]MBH9577065.1 TolC family protein [Inhella proteolytica]